MFGFKVLISRLSNEQQAIIREFLQKNLAEEIDDFSMK